jgi:anti-sigma B factor antagonist
VTRGNPDQPLRRPTAVSGVGATPGREAPSAGDLQLSVMAGRDQARVTARGEVDLATAPSLAECFQRLAARRPKTVIVNLREVTFLDAAGLRPFVAAYHQLRRQGGNLVITSPSQPAARVLELTGLDVLFGMTRPSDEEEEEVR